MSLEALPLELVTQIIGHLLNFGDLACLGAANHRFQKIVQEMSAQFTKIRLGARWFPADRCSFHILHTFYGKISLEKDNLPAPLLAVETDFLDRGSLELALAYVLDRCGEHFSEIELESYETSVCHPCYETRLSSDINTSLSYKFFDCYLNGFYEFRPKIRKLRLVNAPVSFEILGSSFLPECLEELEILLPLDCEQETVDSIGQNFVRKCVNLRRLKVNFCPSESFANETILVQTGLIAEVPKKTGLGRREIPHCMILWNGLESLRNLEQVDLFVSAMVEAINFLSIFQNNKITTLSFGQSLQSFNYFQECFFCAENAPIFDDLEELTVHYLVANLRSIIAHCRRLKRLKLTTGHPIDAQSPSNIPKWNQCVMGLISWKDGRKERLHRSLTVEFPDVVLDPKYRKYFLREMVLIRVEMFGYQCTVEPSRRPGLGSHSGQTEVTYTIRAEKDELNLVWFE